MAVENKKIKFSKIGLCLTDRCNAECRMCCFSCSPRNSRCFGETELERIIKQAAGIQEIEAVGLTGGEAMLYPREVHFAIKQAKACGLRTSLASNGFWAKTEKTAYEELEALKRDGLSDLSVSTDACHLEFVELGCLKNLLRANRHVGLPIRIALGDLKNGKRAYEILKELDEDIYETQVVVYPFLPVGKGRNIDPGSTRSRPYEPGWTCPAAGELMIMPSGDTYPCCSQAIYGSALSKGNIYKAGLGEIVEAYKHFCFFSLLRNKGFHWFYEILTEKENRKLPGSYVSPCHLCHIIFTDKELTEKLKPYYKRELYENARNILNL